MSNKFDPNKVRYGNPPTILTEEEKRDQYLGNLVNLVETATFLMQDDLSDSDKQVMEEQLRSIVGLV